MTHLARMGRLAAASSVAAAIAAHATPAEAGATNARALGMGNAYAAVAEEADMAAWNPALLGLMRQKTPGFTLTAPSLNLGLGNNFFSYDSLLGLLPDDTGNSRLLGDANMDALMKSFNDPTVQFALDSGFRTALAFPSLRTSAMLTVDADMQNVGLPKGIFELLLRGNTTARDIRLEGLKGGTISALASAAVSHATPIALFPGRESSVGVTVRYIQGLAWGTILDASGSVLTMDQDGRLAADGGARAAYTGTDKVDQLLGIGSGVTADLGFASKWNDAITFGFTVGNLGFVKWNKVQDKVATVKFASTNLGMGYNAGADGQEQTTGQPNDPFKNAFTTTSGALDGKSDVDGKIPAYTRFGVSWRGGVSLPRISNSPLYWNAPPVPVVIAADVQQGFGNGYGISTVPELHLGLEARPLGDFVPLRMGVAFGGVRPMVGLGAGLDLRFMKLDLATGTMYGVFGGAKGSYAALTSQMAF